MTAVQVRASGGDYRAVVGRGLLQSLGSLIRNVLPHGCCAVVSDETVASLFGGEVIGALKAEGIDPMLIQVPPGETSKSLEQVGIVCGRMAEARLDRSSFVVALGGGVVGDLAGFAASVYHRGIPCVQVPTTVLAQVDSSIGGKTAVNIAAGKNLVGSFHQPALVVADVELLDRLPLRRWNEGFAEVIKHGIIRDEALFHSLDARRENDISELIRRNIEIKAEIVAADEREATGQRALLNFGHTIGHAIENAAGYGGMLHGEAVSLGIVAAANISMRKAGLSQHDRRAIVGKLQSFGLPTQLPDGFPRERIGPALRFDKKFERGEIRLVVTPRIGTAHVTTDVTFAELEQAVDELGAGAS